MDLRRNPPIVSIITVVLLLIVAPGRASTLTEDELTEELAVFGPGFVVTRIDAPVIENPYDWINRRPGDYTYRFVEGSDDGATRQTERHVPDTASPETDWERRIGDTLVEKFTSSNERDVLIVEETDHEHGFRIEIEPGVHLPPGIRPGDTWEIEAALSVYRIEDGILAYEGTLDAVNSYEAAYRIRTPAGEFDAVLIREDFKVRIGPLKAEDDRFLFYARGVGLVAEIEAIRASALLVIRTREHSAKVLEAYPSAGD